jgi:hypothetical protein
MRSFIFLTRYLCEESHLFFFSVELILCLVLNSSERLLNTVYLDGEGGHGD